MFQTSLSLAMESEKGNYQSRRETRSGYNIQEDGARTCASLVGRCSSPSFKIYRRKTPKKRKKKERISHMILSPCTSFLFSG